jgi:hypothetical protein
LKKVGLSTEVTAEQVEDEVDFRGRKAVI